VVALTGEAGWVALAPLARALGQAHLEARRRALDQALAPLEDRIEVGEEAALREAEAQKSAWVAALGEDGAVLREAVKAALDRAKIADVGLCANPEALGGCPGEDRSGEVLRALRHDRKLAKALEKGWK
jgi:hypothetical protein